MPAKASPAEVFRVFLKLGLTSFGGPIAHIGYFRNELVVRRKWLDDASYGDLVALCQFLPGPASSQVGFSLGVLRGGGILGGLAACLAFTAPSALILLAFALYASSLTGTIAQGLLHGLKLVAVAVVAQADLERLLETALVQVRDVVRPLAFPDQVERLAHFHAHLLVLGRVVDRIFSSELERAVVVLLIDADAPLRQRDPQA